MNILSLFDGISCGQIALERAGIKVDKYYASETNKDAIQVTQSNYPNTIQLGDVCKVSGLDFPHIDLLIGGSPCQGFSFAGKQLKFDDPRSKLFFEFVRLKDELNPKYFLLENIKMKSDSERIFSKYLCIDPITINSALVSGQKRRRFYWTDIPNIVQPEDKGIIFDAIIDYNNKDLLNLALTDNEIERGNLKHKAKIWKSGYRMGNMKFPNTTDKKSQCLTKTEIKGARETNHILDNDIIRLLSVNEYEKLQTLPIGYLSCIENENKAKSLIGNGWTIDIITHILNGI